MRENTSDGGLFLKACQLTAPQPPDVAPTLFLGCTEDMWAGEPSGKASGYCWSELLEGGSEVLYWRGSAESSSQLGVGIPEKTRARAE